MRLYILFILAICSFGLLGQGIHPSQIEATPYEGGILVGKTKVFDQWTGDSVYIYAHDTITWDSLYLSNDTIYLKNGSGFVVLPEMVTDTALISQIVSDSLATIEVADSSKWTVSGTNLFPKSLSYNLGIGLNNPAQQLELTGSFRTPATTSSTTGVWYKGTTPFLHNFKHPTGGGAVPNGFNVFLGENAGNFTAGSTATNVGHSSNNIGLGYLSLYKLAKGYSNMAVGSQSLNALTDGYRNVAIGVTALNYIQTNYENTAIGNQAGAGLRGDGGIFIGANAGLQNSNRSVGVCNTVIGYSAGSVLGTGTNNILIGRQVELALPNTNNQLNIGNAIYATGLGTGSTPSATAAVGIGTSSPATQLHTTGTVRFAGAGTPGAGKVLTSDADGDATWETPAAGGIDSTVVTAGFGIGVSEVSNNFTVRNTRYWNGQDTLKTTLSGLVKATSGVLTAVTDNSSNWNTAYGWGNHASAGYLTSETGDISSVSVTSPITGGGTSGAVTIGINNADANGSTKGAASFTANDFNASSGNISIDYTNGQAASGSNKGFLTSTDWSTFNGKFTLPALTSGSVLFSNGTTIAQDNANLYWDDSNNRLGLGTTSPSYIFHAKKAGSVIGLFEGTGGSGAFGGVEVKADAGTGNYSGYTLSHGTGSYYLQYNTTDGLKIFPDIDQQSLPVSFRTYQGNTRFVINPGTNQIGVYDGTSIDYGSTGEFLGKTASGYAWVTPSPTASDPIVKFAKLHVTGGSQSITAGSTTKVQYNNETDPWVTPSADATNERITVTENGFYDIDINLQGKYSGGSAALNVYIYKNGSSIWTYNLHAVSDNYHANQLNNTLSLAANDYLEVFVKANTLNYEIQQSTFIVKKIAY